MLSLLEKLKEYDNQIIELEKELKQLNEQYCNCATLKQQMTAYIMMMSNLSYKQKVNVLKSKLSLIRAERDKYYTNQMAYIQRMMDIYLGKC
jgi:hypothetical protein